MIAQDTRLAQALKFEADRIYIATRIVNEVLPDSRANDDVRASCLKLIDWLATPAETLVRRGY